MMRKLITCLVLALSISCLGFASSSWCDPTCCECNECDCCGCFDIGFDFLWWVYCTNDLDYGIKCSPEFGEVPPMDEGTYKRICDEFDPGVRVFITKPCFWCDWDLRVSYTYFHSEEIDRQEAVDGASEVNLVWYYPGYAGLNGGSDDGDTMAGRAKLDYQTIEALLYKPFFFKKCHRFEYLFGIEGLKLSRNISADIGNDAFYGTQVWNGNVKALGLKVGTEYSFLCCGCLDIFARATGSLLAGENESSTKYTNGTIGSDPSAVLSFDHADCCIFMPGYHLQGGIGYTGCCCGMQMRAQIGYEFIEWRNVPRPKRFFLSAAGTEGHSTKGTGTTLGLYGLFAGMEFFY